MIRSRAPWGAMLLIPLLACGPSGQTGGDTGMNGGGSDAAMQTPDGSTNTPVGAGTCAEPIDLATAATPMGMGLVYRGSTAGRTDALHPYGGCTERDGAELVFRYQMPAGVQALQISTAGSQIDTALFVRANCSQAMGGVDLVCNNDSYDSAPQSTVYVTNAIEGQVLFIVVDSAGTMERAPAEGDVTLTVTPVTLGAERMPCRPMMDGSTTPRCDGALQCSQGGAADGTQLCVTAVPTGMQCDPRGYTNTCAADARCVADPSPPDGSMNDPVCATPGTRAGAPCRMTEPRCDMPFACGAGDAPNCVRVLERGASCDPMGFSNRCAQGMVCSPLGAGGPPVCHTP